MHVQIDWLTLTVYGELNPKSKHLRIEETEYKTRHFNKVSNVYFKEKKVGVLSYQPHSKVLKSNLANLKIENEVLYSENAHRFISDLAVNLGYSISGVSRVDLCHDFNTFNRNLSPQKFIKGVYSEKYLKNGRTDLNSHATVKPSGIEYETLRYGNHSSRKSVYLYNKTKEMEKKFKGHIFDQWQKNGLDLKQVWRLEISLKLSKGNIIDRETGEMFPIDWNSFENSDFIKRLYLTVINNNFSFKRNTGLKNKTRMPDLILFKETKDKNIVPNIVKEVYTGSDNTRSEKIIISKLEKIGKETIYEPIKEATTFLKENLIREFSLENWYFKKYGIPENNNLIQSRVNTFVNLYKHGVYQSFTARMNQLHNQKKPFKYDFAS